VNDERLVVFFILSLVYFQCNEKEKETIENNPKQRELNEQESRIQHQPSVISLHNFESSTNLFCNLTINILWHIL